jgi:protein-S-isoprenylcysteine O-methyltransferase Ste14
MCYSSLVYGCAKCSQASRTVRHCTAGILAMLAGSIACIFSCICLGRSFSPLVSPRKNNELVTTGMYQYMRHPFYAGLILLAFGLAAVTYCETRLLLACLLSLVLNYKAKKEEAVMHEKHGDAYDEYSHNVDRFFPTL